MTFRLWGPLNDQMYSMLIIVFILSILSIIIGLKVKKIKPEDKQPWWLVILESLISLINNFVKENMGKWWKQYSPYYLTLALLLFFSNIASIFLLTSPTSYLSVNFGLALTSFFVIQSVGIRSNGILGYLKSFVSPVFIILPINLISEFALPVSLSLRLFGNISSSNVLVMFLEGLLGYGTIIPMPIFNIIFDIGFGIIQVMVFVLLSIIFASNKVNEKDLIIE